MMGSIGEEELVQMVTDYIESESTTPPIPPTAAKQPQSLLQDILEEATEFETQILEKVLMYVRNMGEPSGLKKWVVMRLQMDGYEASLCKTSWVSSFGRPKVFQFAGDYEYIDVMAAAAAVVDKKPTRLIVDMDFRSQFELARPTQAYKDLIETLPRVFVGTEERLSNIISLMCSAAKQSMKEKGMHIPPWRKAKYMQSKWLSNNCKKVSVVPSISSNTPEAPRVNRSGVEKGGGSGDTSSSTCCPSIF